MSDATPGQPVRPIPQELLLKAQNHPEKLTPDEASQISAAFAQVTAAVQTFGDQMASRFQAVARSINDWYASLPPDVRQEIERLQAEREAVALRAGQ